MKIESKEINEYVNQYGRGDRKLTADQKKKRIDAILGSESDKIKGAGTDPGKGVDMIKISAIKKNDDALNNIDLDSYPADPHDTQGKHKILNIICDDEGAISIQGIIKDGNEKDRATRGIYSTDIPSDESLYKLEKRQIQDGKLKEVAKRTLSLHKENGTISTIESDESIVIKD